MINFWHDINVDASPLLATAIHNGHSIRSEAAEFLDIGEFDRLREEDPCTGYFTDIAPSRFIIHTSRFETDVNRPRESAVYRYPEQSWGIKVWKDNVPEKVWENSLKQYDDFYKWLKQQITLFIEKYGFIVVYDIHSYNFKRENRETGDDPLKNPEINVGTGTLNHKWIPLVEHFKSQLRAFNFLGRHLIVEENVRFKGGFLSEWVHANYPERSCVLAIEFKKIFMDEWTGAVNINRIKALKAALNETVQGTLREAGRLRKISLPSFKKHRTSKKTNR